MRITHVLLAVAVALPVAACTSDEAEVPGSPIPGTDGSEVDGGTQVDGGGSGGPPESTSPQMTPAPNPAAGGGSGAATP